MIFYRVLALAMRPLLWTAFRPQVWGTEHVPREGGFVLSANHLSGFDMFAIAYSLAPRPLRNMGKNQLFRRPLLGPLVRSLGAFPAHNGEEFPGGVSAAAALAGAGEVVVIFPEGARRRTGRTHRPHTGAAATALVAEVPLIPAAVRGTDGWRRLRRWRVAFGPPITLDDLGGRERAHAAREATRRLWGAITALEATRDVY